MLGYSLAFGVGMVFGILLSVFWVWRTVKMYRLLWENEKSGNLLMMRRVMALEEERMGLDDDKEVN